jgi:GNAT superfamily N-acetyltransferase
MDSRTIEAYTKQCSIKQLWEFIEESLSVNGLPYPMYWISRRKLEKRKKKGEIFLAMQGKKMVGCIIVKGNNIEILCVRKRYKKRGIGSELVGHVEQKLRKDRRRKYVKVDSLKAFKAKPFYEGLGFRDYRCHRWDHTWHLRKEIQ